MPRAARFLSVRLPGTGAPPCHRAPAFMRARRGIEPAAMNPRGVSFGPRSRTPSPGRRAAPARGDHAVDRSLDVVRLDADVGKTGPTQETQLVHGPTTLQTVAQSLHDTGDRTLDPRGRGLDNLPEVRTKVVGIRRTAVGHDVPKTRHREIRRQGCGDRTASSNPVWCGCFHDSFPLLVIALTDCPVGALTRECMSISGCRQRMIAVGSMKKIFL